MGRSLNRQREHPSSDHSRRAKKKRTTADQPPPIGGTHKELKRPPRKSQGRVNVVFQPKVQLQKPNTRTTEETTGTACGGPKPEKNPRTARKKPQRPHPSSCGTSRKSRPPPPDHHQPEGQEGPRTERVVRRAKHLDRHTGTSPRVMWPRVRRPTPTRPPAHDTRLAGVHTGGGPVSVTCLPPGVSKRPPERVPDRPAGPPPHDTPRPTAETLDPVATHAVARSAGTPPRAATPAKPTRKRGGGVGGVRGRPPNQTRPRVPPLAGARRMREGSDALQSGFASVFGPCLAGAAGSGRARVGGRRLPGPTTVGLAPGYFVGGPGHRPFGLFGGPVASVWRASKLLTE